MSDGGKGGGSPQVVGYRYYCGVHIALCHGPVDAITEIIVGERQGWTGNATTNTTLSINKPELFGGDSREGGLVGNVDVLMGASSQARNAYLQSFQGAGCPAYRGITSMLFKAFRWSSGNPYFKAPWVRVKRIISGWNTTVWNSGNAQIGTYDMNPAHIIYQCLTDPKWGMGYNTTDIDTVSFAAAASTLYNESFGLSLTWDQQSTINDFVKMILDHVNGTLRLDLSTGKFVLKLVRDDYTIGTLTNLNPSNVIDMKSFQRAAYGDLANEVVVTYRDRDENDKTVAVQDLASIQSQAGVVSVSREYPGIRDANLAARVAMRDLATTSTPLAKISLTANRVLYDKEIGDAVSITWPDLGIDLAAFRIVKIDKGTILNGKIEVELVEDVFGLPTSAYTTAPDSSWSDTALAPVAVEAGKAVEAPYWEVVRNVTKADQAQLVAQYGFGTFLATRGVGNAPINFVLSESASSGGTYTDVATGHFCPTGTLTADIGYTDATFTLSNFYDLDSVLLDSPDNGYAVIDNEVMAVVSADSTSGVVVVRRGCLDTPPAKHLAGARMFFVIKGVALDTTERVSGEVAYYKPRPRTGLGTLALASATAVGLTMQNRASRPYPPGQFKINGSYYPNNIDGITIPATWAHRDRTQQTVSLNDYTAGNIGPEAGTTYVVKVYSGVTLKRTYAAITGTSWSYPVADAAADGYLQTVRITAVSDVGGVQSLYPIDHTVERYGLGFHLGDSLGGIAPP